MNGLKGKEKINRVLVLYLLIPGIVLALLNALFPVTPNSVIANSFLVICWGLVNIVSIWRCAFNTNKRFVGYLSRVGTLLLAVALIPQFVHLVTTLHALSVYGQPN